MSLEPDYIADRRRLKRRITAWRALAIAAGLVLILVLLGEFGPLGETLRRDHIARLTVDGLILDDPARRRAIERLAGDDTAKALIVFINSPGGTTVGGEALYRSIRTVAEDRPVVAVIGTLATSAGYMVALAADHIVAPETSITGSIGVLLQATEFTGLLERLGIATVTIKSTPLKATPSPLEVLTPEARAAAQSVVDDVYQWFVDLFAERRGLTREVALQLADGRVFTGRQALAGRMIDAVGSEAEALIWLATARDIDANLPVRDIIERHDGFSVFDILSSLSRKTLFSERLRLDGLISVWQPDR
jgi:protease-4